MNTGSLWPLADPTDEQAVRDISAALNIDIYPVQANPTAIDELLAETWPNEHPLRFLLYHQGDDVPVDVQQYTDYLQGLMHAWVSPFQVKPGHSGSLADVAAAACGHDLVIFAEPGQSLIKRLLLGPPGCQAAERIPTSVLLARQPRWPIKKILLVTRGQEGIDDRAVDWLIRLVQATSARVTVLGIVLPMPAIYQRAMTHLPNGPAGWLSTDTPLGRQLSQISHRLENWHIDGVLRFREGSPDRQIRREVAYDDYDLVVVAPDPHDWWQRRLLGELVDPLLHWIDRPVLIAKSTLNHA
jgi:nucleotide-binding universal stress UspA family protein